MTDPPYNVNYEGGTDEHLTIMNDDMSSDGFRAFLTDAFRQAAEYLKPGGAFYIWHASWGSRALMDACQAVGLKIAQTLVWVKNTFVLGHMDYQWQQEPCFYGWKEGAAHYFVPDRDLRTVIEGIADIDGLSEEEAKAVLTRILTTVRTDVVRENKPLSNGDHPTMKPVPLLARLIANSSREGETVLDIFGGSGSTLLACESLHRRCVMMELDPVYCDVIVRRWEEMTGRKVEIAGGRGDRRQGGQHRREARVHARSGKYDIQGMEGEVRQGHT